MRPIQVPRLLRKRYWKCSRATLQILYISEWKLIVNQMTWLKNPKIVLASVGVVSRVNIGHVFQFMSCLKRWWLCSPKPYRFADGSRFVICRNCSDRIRPGTDVLNLFTSRETKPETHESFAIRENSGCMSIVLRHAKVFRRHHNRCWCHMMNFVYLL